MQQNELIEIVLVALSAIGEGIPTHVVLLFSVVIFLALTVYLWRNYWPSDDDLEIQLRRDFEREKNARESNRNIPQPDKIARETGLGV